MSTFSTPIWRHKRRGEQEIAPIARDTMPHSPRRQVECITMEKPVQPAQRGKIAHG
jgi:hypothetical protein